MLVYLGFTPFFRNRDRPKLFFYSVTRKKEKEKTPCSIQYNFSDLHLLQNSLLEFTLHLLAGLIRRSLTVQTQQRTEIEFWCL